MVRQKHILLGLIIVISILRIYSITWSQGIMPDELSYTGIARNLIEGLGYGYDAHRPILYPHALSLLYFITGPTLFAARMLSVFIGLLGVVMIYFLGKRMYGKDVALYSALILAATPFFWFYSTKIMVEALLVLGTIIFLYFLFSIEKNKKYLIPATAMLSVLFLIKFIGGIFLLVMLVYILWKRYFKIKYFWIGFLIAFLILVPWFMINQSVYGNPFGSALDHFSRSEGFAASPSLFFIYAFPVMSALFLPFAVLGLYYMWKNKDRNVAILLLILLLFSLFLTGLEVKRFRFFIPIIPVLTITAAYSFSQIKKIRKEYVVTLLLVILTVGSVFITYHGFYNHPKIDRFISLGQASEILPEVCTGKSFYSDVPGYGWWFIREPAKGITELDYEKENTCTFVDTYYGKNETLISLLTEKYGEPIIKGSVLLYTN